MYYLLKDPHICSTVNLRLLVNAILALGEQKLVYISQHSPSKALNSRKSLYYFLSFFRVKGLVEVWVQAVIIIVVEQPEKVDPFPISSLAAFLIASSELNSCNRLITAMIP